MEKRILTGYYVIGEKIPPLRNLAEEFHVSRSVINAGVVELSNNGYLVTIPRKHTVVADWKNTGNVALFNGLIENGLCDNKFFDDLIEGMIRMMRTGDDFTGPVNIGNPGEFTMLELAQKVIELTGSKSKIIFQPLPQDDPRQRKPDISLAHEKLDGWEPTIKLEEGLKHTIEYFKKLV